MTRALSVALCLAAFCVATTACSSSAEDTRPSSTSPTTLPADTPARRRVRDECRQAQLQLDRLTDLVKQGDGLPDYPTVDAALADGADPVEECQSAVVALFPDLSAAMQSTASSYAGSLDSIIVAIQAPPANAADVQPWVEQFSAAAAEAAEQTKAMSEADPTILG